MFGSEGGLGVWRIKQDILNYIPLIITFFQILGFPGFDHFDPGLCIKPFVHIYAVYLTLRL